MATLTVELVEIDASPFDASAVMRVLNANQHAFHFESLSGEFCEQIRNALSELNPMPAPSIFDVVGKNKPPGFHPHIVATFARQIDGEPSVSRPQRKRLFSAVQERSDRSFTGLAVISLYEVDRHLKGIPKEVYVAFQLLSVAIRFAVGSGMLHDERPECVFHRRDLKDYIQEALRSGRLCDACSDKLKPKFEERQHDSVSALLGLIRRISRAKDPAAAWRAEVAHAGGAAPQPQSALRPEAPAQVPTGPPPTVPSSATTPGAGASAATGSAAGASGGAGSASVAPHADVKRQASTRLFVLSLAVATAAVGVIAWMGTTKPDQPQDTWSQCPATARLVANECGCYPPESSLVNALRGSGILADAHAASKIEGCVNSDITGDDGKTEAGNLKLKTCVDANLSKDARYTTTISDGVKKALEGNPQPFIEEWLACYERHTGGGAGVRSAVDAGRNAASRTDAKPTARNAGLPLMKPKEPARGGPCKPDFSWGGANAALARRLLRQLEPHTGWVFLGFMRDDQTFSEGPYWVTEQQKVPSGTPIKGQTIALNARRTVYIVDYRKGPKERNAMTAPERTIDEGSTLDDTNVELPACATVLVKDVSRKDLKTESRAKIWARVVAPSR